MNVKFMDCLTVKIMCMVQATTAENGAVATRDKWGIMQSWWYAKMRGRRGQGGMAVHLHYMLEVLGTFCELAFCANHPYLDTYLPGLAVPFATKKRVKSGIKMQVRFLKLEVQTVPTAPVL